MGRRHLRAPWLIGRAAGTSIRRAAVVWITAIALAWSPLALASMVPGIAPADELPCHMGMPMDAAAATPSGDTEPAPAKAPDHGCPMMQGALCLSLCAVGVPTYQVAAPRDIRSAPHAWRAAAWVPHVVPPPQRPPNTI